jgi:hypothetical protein
LQGTHVMKFTLALLLSVAVCGCTSSPTALEAGPLAAGHWSSNTGQCLSVTESSCNFVAGCGHGQFPRPQVNADGTFQADGTYRVEVGPILIQPAPRALFYGSVSGSKLILTVTPTDPSLSISTYTLFLNGTGTCSVVCV